MNRREFLQCASVLVSGAGFSHLALTEEQKIYLAAAPDYNAGKVNYLSPARRLIVAAMAETIIPKTDTPGAIDAGVPVYLERMMADWLNDKEKAVFDAGLADLETRIPAEYGKPFHALEPEQQQQILVAMEEAAADSAWYAGGRAPGVFLSDAPFICQFKELAVFGFFTSEVGSTQVLRYDPMPMYFDGDVPLGPNESGLVPLYIF
jgi:hypothetical protein